MRYVTLTLAIALGCTRLVAADSKVSDRLGDAADFFSEVMSTPDRAVPQDLLNKAACVILVPGLKKGAFLIGAKYGRGFAVCRGASGMGWGPPAAVRVEGGGVGFQIGVSSTDVLLLVMNERGMKRLTTSKFTLGGEATVAAGPVGRDAQAQTDALMTAEILSWSRSHGVFAGISLDGATLRNDLDVNKEMYGQPWDNKQVLTSGAKPPAAASKLIAALSKYSPRKTN
ncbi:MAG TPA: lipid-binding SYLF domain-containing protein [Bryobacteraceae bacterium]|nr:lipid-binding SYLF domain-containing protein [Bryobacteraceae bacterium]